MFKFSNYSDSQEEESLIVSIQKHHVLKSQIQIDQIVCSICHNILWRPIVCGVQSGCHNFFCKKCIDYWLNNLMQKQMKPTCPNCKSIFVCSNPPPILKSILNNLAISCQNIENGCNQSMLYGQAQNHLKVCQYRKKKCYGCKELVIAINYDNHTQNCEKYIIQCQKCKRHMSKSLFIKRHIKNESNSKKQGQKQKQKQNKVQMQLKSLSLKNSQQRSVQCFQFEIEEFDQSLKSLQNTLKQLNDRADSLQNITNNFLSVQPILLNISFFTSFTQHFTSSIQELDHKVPAQITLTKASYNQQKQKYDFLHFYLSNSIYLNSAGIIKWRIKLTKMEGNVLIGFCNSMSITSLDYIINKHGELKRKNQTQNRYKIIKKYDFIFVQEDVITFLYVGKLKQVKIINETRKCQVKLGEDIVQQFMNKEKMYAFYSLDTLNDSMQFIN